MYIKYIKRIFDFVLAMIGLVMLSPLFLVLAILIKWDSSGPVFFKQKRIKKGKETFTMLKFRTMSTEAPRDMPTHMFKHSDAHITKIGRFLRRYSLDETIQLYHIIEGSMTIIGPRPALWNQYDLIAQRDEYGANDVKPGLTGWAQINGRDELPIEVKARLDGEYVENMNFLFDVKCFWRTLLNVVIGNGVIEGYNKEKEIQMYVTNEETVIQRDNKIG